MELRVIVQAAQYGDQEAFALIVERFQHMAYVIAYARVADRHLAEDIAQEAFVEAFQCLPQLRSPQAFPAWFRRILIKRADRMTRRPVAALPLDAAEEYASAAIGPDQAAEQGELRFLVRHSLRGLSASDQQVLGLYYLYGYSLREMAEISMLPVATLKKRLFDARQRLRQRVEQDYAHTMDSYFMSTGDRTIMRTSTLLSSSLLGRAIRYDGSALDDGTAIQDIKNMMLSATPHRQPKQELYETAIKVIDLYAPLTRYALTTIVAGSGIGKWVVTFEILLRAVRQNNACIVWVVCSSAEFSLREFLGELRVATLDQASVLIGAEYTDSSEQKIQTGMTGLHLAQALIAEGRDIFLVVDEGLCSAELLHKLPESGATTLAWLNHQLEAHEAVPDHILVQAASSVIVMSKQLAQRHMWPAIDPLRSYSNLMSSEVVTAAHAALAAEAQTFLRTHEHLDASENSAVTAGMSARARRLLRYNTQPFFVAEEFTGRSGQQVPLTRTLQDVRVILDGTYDARPEEELSFIGALPN